MVRVCLVVVAATAAAAIAAPSQALAVDVLHDGGFEAASCSGTGCGSSNWNPSTAYYEGPSAVPAFGPICDPVVCDPSGDPPEMAPRSGSKWAMFGGQTTAQRFYDLGSLAQGIVPFPAGRATLNFYVRETDGRGTSSIQMTLDGTEIYSATSAPPEYSLVSIDVTAFAGASRTFAISFTGSGDPGPASASDRWQLDDLSLDVVLPDADGDGSADSVDTCPALAGPGTSDGCPRVTRSLTLKYSDGAFRGKLTPTGPCGARQIVSVFRNRRGGGLREGGDRTDARGKFVVESPGHEGVYYAQAVEVFDSSFGHCSTAQSPLRRLN